MSKASEWAKRLDQATIARAAIRGEEPTPFTLHLCGRASLYLRIDESGIPSLRSLESRKTASSPCTVSMISDVS